MPNQGRAAWRIGYDGLLAAMLKRAMLDWQEAKAIPPTRAMKLAGVVEGNTVELDACRFAVSVGFASPAQEIASFFSGSMLRSLLDLCGLDEGFIERMGYCG